MANRKYFVMLLAFLLLGLVSASFQIGDEPYDFEKEYTPNSNLQGWINISFNDESWENYFNDSLGNSFTLSELLDINPGFQFDENVTSNKINTSNFQKLYFDNASFTMPNIQGNFTYSLSFEGQEIFNETIDIVAPDSQVAIDDLLSEISDLKTSFSSYDLYSQQSLISVLGLSSIEAKLNSLKTSNLTEQQILANVSNITIPGNIVKTKTVNSLPIFPKVNNVDLYALKIVAGGDYELNESEEYENAVIGWLINNADIEISSNEFSTISNGTQKVILTTFSLVVTKKASSSSEVYTFIVDDNFNFSQNYGEYKEGYYVIESSSGKSTFNFYTKTSKDFEDLEFFVAPPLANLGVEDFSVEPFQEEKNFKWVIFTLIIVLLFIIAIVVYVALQVWYKKKYEAYLFKDKNELYNLANYISISKKKGMDNSEISSNLRKAKWSNEQIRYALRKYSGKRTGMFEIPLGKVIDEENKK